MSDDEDIFEKERAAGLGSTDSAAILGKSPWASAFTVYQEKTGQMPARESTLPMYLGLKLERTIAELFTARTGKKVRMSNIQHSHPVWPFIKSHVDFRVVGEPAVLELKTARSLDGWGEDGSSDIPVHYWIQVQHQLLVLGMPYAYLAALFGHFDFRTYTIARDFDFTEKLAAVLVEFWEQHVKAGIAPELDGSDAASSFIRQRYPADTEPALPATPEQSQLVEQLLAARGERMASEARENALANQVKELIGEHGGLVGAGWQISWKKSKPTMVTDWHAIADGLASTVGQETLAHYVKAHTVEREGSRPFIIKTEKSDEQTQSSATTQS